MKIPESKRSKIGIIAEFRGIPNGFPNLEMGLERFDSPFGNVATVAIQGN